MKNKFGINVEDFERRAFTLQEVRVVSEGEGSPLIEGYAAVFNQLSEDLGGFKERIKPGAFKKTIKEADIRALWNHDPNFVLGRNKAGTLDLGEDETGLRIKINPPNTSWANDLQTTMRRGDVDQMSFGFMTVKDKWFEEDESVIRELHEVKLYDVSPVTFPAYPQTVVSVRALDQAGLDVTGLIRAITRSSEGEITSEDRDLLNSVIRMLQDLAGEPGQVPHSGSDTEQPDSQVRLAMLMNQLDLEAQDN